ncbi:hypothetical protein ACN42_g288 [Penicillium freii]|uniref:Uncharacterized protein n=1 Tax=Penicillium freii TaxID=48697 RepID=A0A117NST0_PENFR|nr:hypothetical protein ACN42_g288 [Penicillium freii]
MTATADFRCVGFLSLVLSLCNLTSSTLYSIYLTLHHALRRPPRRSLLTRRHRANRPSAKPVKPTPQPNPTRKWAGFWALSSGPPTGHGHGVRAQWAFNRGPIGPNRH